MLKNFKWKSLLVAFWTVIFMFIAFLFSFFCIPVFADSNTTTATDTKITDGVQFTDGVRITYSKDIEFKALPLMRFSQFAAEKTELGKEPGLTISMLTYDNLKLGGALKELIPMETQAMSGSMKQLTVIEHGNAVSVTELLLQTSFDDIMASATTLLSRDYAMTMDCELRDVALSGINVVFASKSDGTKVTTRTDLDATCTLKVSTIKDALEILAAKNAAPYDGQYWICFVHPHQSRNLRDDPAWINASNYGAPELLFTGEIGRIDNTRFIETSIMCNGDVYADDNNSDIAYKPYLAKGFTGDTSNPALTKCSVYQSCIFGDRYLGIAWSLPVELRDDGVKDFGRKHNLAWYAIWGTGILNKNHGVVIETA